MMERGRLLDGRAGLRTFTRRAAFVGAAQTGIAALVFGRLAYLAVARHEEYRLRSRENRLQTRLLPPPRAQIVDREGRELATNRYAYRVDLIPGRIRDESGVTARLKSILRLKPAQLRQIERDLQDSAGYMPVAVADHMPFREFAKVTVRLPSLPGVEPVRTFSRHYPLGPSLAHVVGSVGTPSRADYEAAGKDPLLLTPGVKIGKRGIEKALEERIRGEPGRARVELTAEGDLVRELDKVPGRMPEPLALTIDAELQDYGARRLGPESGSAVVLDVATGEILCMASMPAFDPNSFADGISHAEWTRVREDHRLPLLNKTLQGLYPPGSTLKPAAALALLEEGADPRQRVHCSGAYSVGRGTWHCWKRGGHGEVDLNDAVAQSCDVYFYHMVRQLGIGPVARVGRMLGLQERFDLPLPSQRYGTMPDENWKEEKYGQEWTVADTINASIGQGYVLANPLQLAVMAGRLAAGANIVPHLLLRPARRRPPALAIPEEHLAIVRRAMYDVVNGGGTAGGARLPLGHVKLAGKTGTSQVRRISQAERRSGVLTNDQLAWKLRDHGLFIAYAPITHPRYAVAVVIQHGGGSSAAYPVARDLLTFLFDKRKATAALLKLEQQWGGSYRERMAAEAT